MAWIVRHGAPSSATCIHRDRAGEIVRLVCDVRRQGLEGTITLSLKCSLYLFFLSWSLNRCSHLRNDTRPRDDQLFVEHTLKHSHNAREVASNTGSLRLDPAQKLNTSSTTFLCCCSDRPGNIGNETISEAAFSDAGKSPSQ